MPRSSRRVCTPVIAILLAVTAASACTRPTSVYRSPAAVVASEGSKALELQLTTGEHYTIRDARIQNDSLYAVMLGRTTLENTSLAIPVASIASLSSTTRGVSVSDAAKVTLSAVTIAAVIMGLAALSLLLSLQ